MSAIEIKSGWTKAKYLRYQLFSLRRHFRRTILTGLAAVLVGVALLVFFQMRGLAIFLMVAGVVSPLLTWLIAYVKISKRYDTTPKLLNAQPYLFTFHSKGLTARRMEDDEQSELKWADLPGAIERRGDFYVFVAPKNAVCITPDEFTTGTPDELRKLFAERLGKKFSKMQ